MNLIECFCLSSYVSAQGHTMPNRESSITWSFAIYSPFIAEYCVISFSQHDGCESQVLSEADETVLKQSLKRVLSVQLVVGAAGHRALSHSWASAVPYLS